MRTQRGHRTVHTHCKTCGTPLDKDNEVTRRARFADGFEIYREPHCRACYKSRDRARDEARKPPIAISPRHIYPQYWWWLADIKRQVTEISKKPR